MVKFTPTLNNHQTLIKEAAASVRILNIEQLHHLRPLHILTANKSIFTAKIVEAAQYLGILSKNVP